ncbi:MAG: hypothetical protein ABII64_08140 [Elusimicrobiota bacterium]
MENLPKILVYKIAPEAILLETKLITPTQAEEIRKMLSEADLPVSFYAQLAVDTGFAGKPEVLKALAERWQMPVESDPALTIDYKYLNPDNPFSGILPFQFCYDHSCIPISADAGTLKIAVPLPLDPLEMEDIRMRTAKEVMPVLSMVRELHELLGFYTYVWENKRIGPGGDIRSIIEGLIKEGKIKEAEELDPKVTEMLLKRGNKE